MRIELAGDGTDVLEVLRERDGALQEARHARPGYHVSGLLRDLQVRAGTRQFNNDIRVDTRLRWEAGYTWEELLERAFALRSVENAGPEIIRPDPLYSPVAGIPHPIVLSPDGMDTDAWVIHEYKLTWKSDSAGLAYVEGRWDWKQQIAAYLGGVGADEARLHVFHVNADYRPPQPRVREWRLLYSDAEIKETRKMLETHARRLAAEGLDRI